MIAATSFVNAGQDWTAATRILAGGSHDDFLSGLVEHAKGTTAARALDFGCVLINTHIPWSEVPHGGFKHSGYGKT
jgi:acyl-CoA reductase-like NAD-dependent aldehyde dehydrogenase